ncbi:MAG: hypothetical protein IKU80_00580 [Firmicutes bacterium]|nr:hypothetical protein [Bacillota bacterium]
MEKFKKYIKSCLGGILCAAGCFVIPQSYVAKNIMMHAVEVAAELVMIFWGSSLVLPDKDSRFDMERFVFFAAGMLSTVCLCK